MTPPAAEILAFAAQISVLHLRELLVTRIAKPSSQTTELCAVARTMAASEDIGTRITGLRFLSHVPKALTTSALRALYADESSSQVRQTLTEILCRRGSGVTTSSVVQSFSVLTWQERAVIVSHAQSLSEADHRAIRSLALADAAWPVVVAALRRMEREAPKQSSLDISALLRIARHPVNALVKLAKQVLPAWLQCYGAKELLTCALAANDDAFALFLSESVQSTDCEDVVPLAEEAFASPLPGLRFLAIASLKPCQDGPVCELARRGAVDPDSRVQQLALAHLLRARPEEGLKRLQEQFDGSHDRARSQVARTILALAPLIPQPKKTEILLRVLEDAEVQSHITLSWLADTVREELTNEFAASNSVRDQVTIHINTSESLTCRRALLRLFEHSDRTEDFQFVRQFLDVEDAESQILAVQLLASMQHPDVPGILGEIILRATNSEEGDDRSTIARSTNILREAAQGLQHCLTGPLAKEFCDLLDAQPKSELVEEALIIALGGARSPRALQHLANALEHPDALVAEAARKSLAIVQAPGTNRLLEKIVFDEKRPAEERYFAAKALSTRKGASPALLKLLGDARWEMRALACIGLSDSAQTDVLSAMIPLLDDRHEAVRALVRDILEQVPAAQLIQIVGAAEKSVELRPTIASVICRRVVDEVRVQQVKQPAAAKQG